MISPELEKLHKSYAIDLRDSKEAAERWWAGLNDAYAAGALTINPKELWPMGPVSHPWVIATYRKYFFECVEHNELIRVRDAQSPPRAARESEWGVEHEAEMAETVEPKTFVLDLLSGGDTDDLYQFLLSLVFIPIGLKGDEQI